MDLPQGARVTTEILWWGTLVFAALDIPLLLLLRRVVKPPAFAELRRVLPVVAGIVWLGIWLWAMTYFWERVYAYVFPHWSRWYLPAAQALLTGFVAWIAVRVASRASVSPVVTFCLLGGTWGALTHVWAVLSGIVTKPPLLRGAAPHAAVIIAFFEFTFYFCVVVVVSHFAHRAWRRLLARQG